MNESAITDFETPATPGEADPTPPPTPEPTPQDPPRTAPPEVTTPTAPEPNAEKTETPEPDSPKQRARHRAASQQAGPQDVPRIQELTRKLREAERERDEWKAKHAPRPEPPQARAAGGAVPSPTVPPAVFSESEPTLDDFAQAEDPYAAYVRALARYDRNKEAFDAKQAEAQSREKQTREQDEQARQQAFAAHLEREKQFVATHPDYREAIEKVSGDDGPPIPPLLGEAVIRSDKSADLMYYLATHPEVLDQFVLDTLDKPVTPQAVAILQRRLLTQTRTQAVTTGSAAATAPSLAPRPPNPVRTGPLKTGDEPYTDDISLEEHEKRFVTMGHRRRR